jgi:hypothetical protein
VVCRTGGDFRGVRDFTITYTDIMRIREVFARLRKLRGYRGSVILVDSDFQYGMARMAATVIEVVRPIHVARNETEAAAKLQEILAGDPLEE